MPVTPDVVLTICVSSRLAPQDHHRFHSPVDGVLGNVTDIPGQYYTGAYTMSTIPCGICELTVCAGVVNPQAVNEPGFDVFTDNKRSVLYMTHSQSNAPVAFVAIGAMLVGSIVWTRKEGEDVKRGEELGYFAYGGSTVVVVYPKGFVEFDEDLVEN